MGIPYGTEYTAQITLRAQKTAVCECCSEEYIYEVERKASGQGMSFLWMDNDGAQERASERARQNGAAAIAKAIDPVPCPGCGWLQEGMIRILKNKRRMWVLCAGLVAAAVLLIWGLVTRLEPANHSGLLLASSGALAVASVVFGQLAYAFCGPNSGHLGPGFVHHERAESSRGIPRAVAEAKEAARVERLQTAFRDGILKIVVMVLRTGEPSSSQSAAAADVVRKMTGEECTIEEIVRRPRIEAAALQATLQSLQDDLNDNGKEMLFMAGLMVAAADGRPSDERWSAVVNVAAWLGMSQQQFDAIIGRLSGD